MAWTPETSGDPGIALWGACRAAGAPMPFPPPPRGTADSDHNPLQGGLFRVLEIGCCESKWLELASEEWPHVGFVGVDQRPRKYLGDRCLITQGDVRRADLFQPESFDAIVSLSAIEHVGLGHYGDPKDEHGDTIAVMNAWTWLKPGGWFYFDVPYDPTGYRVQGTKCRVYDDAALAERLSMSMARGEAWAGVPVTISRWMAYPGSPYYADANAAGRLIPKPTAAVRPFHYVAMVWQKA